MTSKEEIEDKMLDIELVRRETEKDMKKQVIELIDNSVIGTKALMKSIKLGVKKTDDKPIGIFYKVFKDELKKQVEEI